MLLIKLAALCALMLSLTPLAALANGYEAYPSPIAWSPDSQHVAAVIADGWPYGHGATQGSLKVYDRFGKVVGDHGSGELASPQWRDANMLSWIGNGEIIVNLNMDGGGFSAIAPHDALLDCRWGHAELPSDEAPLFYSSGERFYGADIWRSNASGSQLKQVTGIDTPGDSELSPVPLPDCRRLLYLSQSTMSDAAYERLWMIDLHTGESKQLTSAQAAGQWPDDYHESNPIPLSNGEVLFQRGGWGDWRLVLLNIDSGEEWTEFTDAQQPSLSSDGRWLAFTRRAPLHKDQLEYDWDAVPQIWLADRLSGEQWRVETALAGGEHPAVSPDGKRLAWLSFDGGEVQLYTASIAELSSSPCDLTATYENMPAGPSAPRLETETNDMDPYNIVLETGRGDIVLEVHPDWSPKGAAHFRELVEAGFYDGAPWFRVLPGFVAQAGIAASGELNRKWGEQNIPDEPVRQSNTRGFVSYGMSGRPNSRTTHIFINYADNSRLDESGFGAFAEVVEGMEIADALTSIPDNVLASRGVDQGSLGTDAGMQRFKDAFPDADYIVRAYVRE